MLGEFLNCPVALPLAGRTYLARSFTLGDLATLVRNANRSFGVPATSDVCLLSLVESEWIHRPENVVLSTWCALRRDQPALTIADVEAIVGEAEVDELSAVLNVAYAMMWGDSLRAVGTADPSLDDEAPAWLSVLRRMILHRGMPPEALAGLTTDQVLFYQFSGEMAAAPPPDPPFRFRLPSLPGDPSDN